MQLEQSNAATDKKKLTADVADNADKKTRIFFYPRHPRYPRLKIFCFRFGSQALKTPGWRKGS